MLWEKIVSHEARIAVIGLGYVGMPIALAFAKMTDVIGFDISQSKIEQYKAGIDPTNEVGNEAIKTTSVLFTSNEEELESALFFVVAVPTPVNQAKIPDLSPVIGASEVVARHLNKDAIIVYESTVYPGVTEEICIPILEKVSGLKCGEDFKIGYSPERINPGDKVHRLETIKKIVSGMDEETLDEIAHVYEMIIKAGVHRAHSIKVAEAAKVAENSQRDINIAFMNELAMVFDRMGIRTLDVYEAMQTKWNALPFRPGLVGGHCIGVDPYYFVYQAEKLGYHSPVIMAGRKINDGMGEFVANVAVRKMVLAEKIVKRARVAILGLTFKENCPDIRNSKVMDIVVALREYGIEPVVSDPYAETKEALQVYGIVLTDIKNICDMDCVIVAVAHKEYQALSDESVIRLFMGKLSSRQRILLDVKGCMGNISRKQYDYWSL